MVPAGVVAVVVKTPFSSYTLGHEPIMRQMLGPQRAEALRKGLAIARTRAYSPEIPEDMRCAPEEVAEFERLLRLARKKGA